MGGSIESPVQKAATHPLTFVRDNWAWFAPVAYVYVSVVGMVQSWLQFRAFNLNVFDFSDLNDFLLAAFREPIALLAVIGMIAYGSLGFVVGAYFRHRRERIGQSSELNNTHRRFNYIMFPLIVVVAPFYGPVLLDGAGRGKFRDRVLDDPSRLISLQLKDFSDNSIVTNSWIRDARLIGMTGRYLFVHTGKDRVLIVPNANVIALLRASTPVSDKSISATKPAAFASSASDSR